jgi:hypothetical protein
MPKAENNIYAPLSLSQSKLVSAVEELRDMAAFEGGVGGVL